MPTPAIPSPTIFTPRDVEHSCLFLISVVSFWFHPACRERQREARSWGGKEVGKGWRGGRNNSYFCHKTEMNTLVPAMPRMDIRLRQGLDRRG